MTARRTFLAALNIHSSAHLLHSNETNHLAKRHFCRPHRSTSTMGLPYSTLPLEIDLNQRDASDYSYVAGNHKERGGNDSGSYSVSCCHERMKVLSRTGLDQYNSDMARIAEERERLAKEAALQVTSLALCTVVARLTRAETRTYRRFRGRFIGIPAATSPSTGASSRLRTPPSETIHKSRKTRSALPDARRLWIGSFVRALRALIRARMQWTPLVLLLFMNVFHS